MVVLPNGDLVAGGAFTTAGGSAANCIARWDGQAWQPMGAGMSGAMFTPTVAALAVLPNGHLVAGGNFLNAGGTSCYCIAEWNGTAWNPMGPGLLSYGVGVSALRVTNTGQLLAGGDFYIGGPSAYVASWNGSSWSSLLANSRSVTSLLDLPNGDIIAGIPSDTFSAGGVMRRVGSSWQGFGGIPPSNYNTGQYYSINALARMPNGDIVVGGLFPSVNGVTASNIARWDGASWLALGTGTNGLVLALTALPNGDLVAAGSFTAAGGTAASRIARWNGTAWAAMGATVGGQVSCMTMTPNGDLAVGGSFTTAGGVTCPKATRLTTTCPATATPYGTGCSGSAGPLTLTATQLPWLGSTYRATAAGFAPGALAFELIGWTSTATPLVSLHPAGGPGCSLLVDSATTRLLLPTNGTTVSQMAIPNVPFLIGAPLHNQVLQLELDPSLALQAIGSTNAVTLTIGSF